MRDMGSFRMSSHTWYQAKSNHTHLKPNSILNFTRYQTLHDTKLYTISNYTRYHTPHVIKPYSMMKRNTTATPYPCPMLMHWFAHFAQNSGASDSFRWKLGGLASCTNLPMYVHRDHISSFFTRAGIGMIQAANEE